MEPLRCWIGSRQNLLGEMDLAKGKQGHALPSDTALLLQIASSTLLSKDSARGFGLL